jgi:hypothetical protein
MPAMPDGSISDVRDLSVREKSTHILCPYWYNSFSCPHLRLCAFQEKAKFRVVLHLALVPAELPKDACVPHVMFVPGKDGSVVSKKGLFTFVPEHFQESL